MNIRLFLFLFMVSIALLSGCVAKQETQSDFADPPKASDEFESFIEKWKLANLIPEDITMTEEHRSNFINYFQKFDDVTRNYVLLLLQGISTGKVTFGNGFDDPENGVYLSYLQFCLYDMNRDEFPELILKIGSCEADYFYKFYTITEGELIDCGELSASHTALYTDGLGDLVRYAGHMGVYDITISTLEGTTIITREIANGTLDYSINEEYPTLEEYGFENYDQYLAFNYIPTLMLAPAG